MKTTTALTGCTCGKCEATADSYGNVDYGMDWSDSRSDYIVRNCPVARMASELGKSIPALIEDGHSW